MGVLMGMTVTMLLIMMVLHPRLIALVANDYVYFSRADAAAIYLLNFQARIQMSSRIQLRHRLFQL